MQYPSSIVQSTFACTVLVLLSLNPLQILAQKSKVITAGVAHDQGDYEKAYRSLETAFEKEEELDDKYRAKAYYYMALTQLDIYLAWRVGSQYEEIGPTIGMDQITMDIQDCERFDETGRYDKKVADLRERLRPVLINEAIQKMSEGNYTLAKHYLKGAMDIADGYMIRHLLGQIEQANGAYINAKRQYKYSIDLLSAKDRETPDLNAAYAYYDLANLYYYYLGSARLNSDLRIPGPADVDSAMKYLDEGTAFLDSEWETIEKKAVTNATFKTASHEVDYETLSNKFFLLDLEISRAHSTDRAATIEKFDKGWRLFPNNPRLILAYAEYVKESDPEKYALLMVEAEQQSENSFEMQYNKGSEIFNEGAEVYQWSIEEKDFEKSKEFMDIAKQKFAGSKPFFERALELEPNSLETISALKQISIQLDDTEEYQRYVEMEKALQD